MRKQTGIILLVTGMIAALAGQANADTLPSGARPISGSVSNERAWGFRLPFQVPEGQVFVLTDLEVSEMNHLQGIKISIQPDDPAVFSASTNSTSNYQRSFQTGLVFPLRPWILLQCDDLDLCHATISYSGYFKPAP